MMPLTYGGVQGQMLAVSCPASTAVFKQNNIDQQAGRIITDPEWLHYELWWYS